MAVDEITAYQEEFKGLVGILSGGKVAFSDAYLQLDPVVRTIIELRQARAQERKLGDIFSAEMPDYAEYVVQNVRDKTLDLPAAKRVPAEFIVGSCYPGESTYYYSDFTPKEFEDVEDDLENYIRNNYGIRPVWCRSILYNKERRGVLVDGHGRVSLANCIGLNDIWVALFE